MPSGISGSVRAVSVMLPRRVYEAVGGLDEALANVSYFYQRDVDEAVDQMQALLEPSLTVALSLMLAWIISAVLTPVYDMLSRLG